MKRPQWLLWISPTTVVPPSGSVGRLRPREALAERDVDWSFKPPFHATPCRRARPRASASASQVRGARTEVDNRLTPRPRDPERTETETRERKERGRALNCAVNPKGPRAHETAKKGPKIKRSDSEPLLLTTACVQLNLSPDRLYTTDSANRLTDFSGSARAVERQRKSGRRAQPSMCAQPPPIARCPPRPLSPCRGRRGPTPPARRSL